MHDEVMWGSENLCCFTGENFFESAILVRRAHAHRQWPIFLSSRAVGLAPYPVSTGQLDSRQAVGDNFA